MRSIIGAYRNAVHAARAVRGLEQHLSVQDVVLVARGSNRPGGSNSLPGEQGERSTDVLVVMSGDVARISRARELLRVSPSPA